MEANLAVARGNQIFFDHDPRRSMRMIGRWVQRNQKK
jgi:hypothetical protein